MFERKNTAIQNAVSGAIAGISTRLVVSPLDVIKIRIQLETKKTSIFNSFQTIIKEEGIRGFFKGNLSAEYLYITYSATQFLTFYEIDKQLEDSILNRSSRSFISGASAGIIATVTTYPLDLLRTRFAAQHQSNVYSSLIQAITQIKQKEGFSGFYRGVIPAAVQVTPYMVHLINAGNNVLFKQLLERQG